MHGFVAFTALIALANAAAIAFRDKGALSARSIDQCELASNCEVTIDPVTGFRSTGFKENMGPGSAWFEENVSTNHSHARRAVDGVHTQLDRLPTMTKYGETKPGDIASQLSGHCLASSCNDVTWTESIATVDEDFMVMFYGDHLTMTADGQYLADDKGYYMDMIVSMAEGMVDSKVWSVTDAGDTTFFDSEQFQGGQYFNVNWYEGTSLRGFVNLKVEYTDEKEKACEDIIGMLGDIAGAVSGEAAAFFGVFDDALCS